VTGAGCRGSAVPDFYLCSGDTVYFDSPIAATQTLPDGRIYRNLVTEAKSHWYPGQILADARYTERRADVLPVRARQAFFEYVMIGPTPRIYRKLSYGPLLDLLSSTCAPTRTPTTATCTPTHIAVCSATNSGSG
jgi:alkaline phosphatase D